MEEKLKDKVEDSLEEKPKFNVEFCFDDVKPDKTQEIIDNCSRIIINYFRNKERAEREGKNL